eukprot:11896002-Alexandrium_andersonii.AAC.1
MARRSASPQPLASPSDDEEVCQFLVRCPCCERFKAKVPLAYNSFNDKEHEDLLVRLWQHAEALQRDRELGWAEMKDLDV